MKFIKLRIADPCDEDWDKMSPTNKGRHCSACSKTVVDFTKMNESDIAETVSNNSHICGYISDKQLNKIYSMPYIQRYKLARFAAACLLVFGLSLFNYSCEYENPQVQLIELVEEGDSIHVNSLENSNSSQPKLDYKACKKGKIDVSITDENK